MSVTRHRSVRITGAVLFAALLLVPLFERGHSHANRDLARPCAVCVAAHHSPAVTTATASVAAPISSAVIAIADPVDAPARRDHTPQSGRAPPLLASRFTVSA